MQINVPYQELRQDLTHGHTPATIVQKLKVQRELNYFG